MVKNNSIVPPSRVTPGKTFIELMGLEDHAERIGQFILNISNWAFLNYMTQCFTEPEVITSALPNDPEVEVFKNSIKNRTSAIALLDFGAGQGRMITAFTPKELQAINIKFCALDNDPNNLEALKELNFQAVYSNYSELPENTFDYILLCNVLHEIPIIEWTQTLNRIIDALKDQGFIVLIEDMRLPKGEKVGEEGFIILDQSSVKELFSLEQLPPQIVPTHPMYQDRILCALLNKQKIGAVNEASIRMALQSLQNTALNKIKRLRKEISNHDTKLRLGRESAFYSQLFINSIFALEKIANTREVSKEQKASK